ncbi:hypothetical protein HYH02_002409 [Chlamydomonas schloesseri]|uniref:Methyltransferase domain-containing protein n=1 Tax=Chlamydomonas schloesseri TaxID=2026947 RepID=A0A835WTB7_9CHLO|nr:hypothetical protein HYH02_002409 [Chlamydomonas schloesseri]|eukprot:KAG2453077.1 hypothetical protein HYH02_002409 [Chlamydomonas schloesseri]
MDASVWDKKYSEEEFVYGQAAERYLNQVPGGALVVELASGEGRNVAYLAAAGHRVIAVDFSQAGLDKTMALVAGRGGGSATARVTPVLADMTAWAPPGGPGSVDAVVLSFCHMRAADRPRVMAAVVEWLKPGGLLIQEVFHPSQVHKGYRETSGGPHDPTMMVELQELRSQLGDKGGEELEGEELEYVLEEGKLHNGMGAVTRYVWRKDPAQ